MFKKGFNCVFPGVKFIVWPSVTKILDVIVRKKNLNCSHIIYLFVSVDTSNYPEFDSLLTRGGRKVNYVSQRYEEHTMIEKGSTERMVCGTANLMSFDLLRKLQKDCFKSGLIVFFFTWHAAW